MRALIDTNILISYLLQPERKSPISIIVRAAILGKFTAVLPGELLAELREAVAEHPYLSDRIPPDAVSRMVDELVQVSDIIPAMEEEIPALVRDLRDDYLLAYALVGRADYLVTGDRDLLILEQIEGLQIISPRAFCDILNATDGALA